MFKSEFWNQIKSAAKAEPNTQIQNLDRLVTEYHNHKGNVEKRHKLALDIEKAAMQAQRAAGKADGAYVAASILRVSANDTLCRLEFDLQARRTLEQTGKEAKPLLKKHRAEALDPEHHKWGLMDCFGDFRKKWKEELLGIASGVNSEQVMLSSFYDYLAGQGRKIRETDGAAYAPKVKYDADWKASKRVIFAKPNHMNNPHDSVSAMRMTKRSKGGSGAFDVYDSKGKWSIFVLDKEGFSACKGEVGKDGTAKHHSSLAGGNDILGAGMMQVSSGRIQAISQQSGHYHPTRAQMLNVLEELDRSGIDLSTITLKAYTYFGDPKGEVPDQWPGTRLPELVDVPAEYYLKTKGEWACNRRVYESSPAYNPDLTLPADPAPARSRANSFNQDLPLPSDLHSGMVWAGASSNNQNPRAAMLGRHRPVASTATAVLDDNYANAPVAVADENYANVPAAVSAQPQQPQPARTSTAWVSARPKPEVVVAAVDSDYEE